MYDEVRLAKNSAPFFLNSVVLIPDLLTQNECHTLIDAAEQSMAGGVARDCLSASARFLGMSSPFALGPVERRQVSSLEVEAQELSATVLRDRVLPFMEKRLPDVAKIIFGQSSALQSMDFSFSEFEPAVNRYTAGGAFDPHEDCYSITVNVLLSDPGMFSGGGTALWPQDTLDSSSGDTGITLHPRQGMGIIYSGDLTHAGRAVVSGIRHVYVASFDLTSATFMPTEEERNRVRLWRGEAQTKTTPSP